MGGWGVGGFLFNLIGATYQYMKSFLLILNIPKAALKQLKRKTSYSRYAWLTSKANYLLSLLET